MEQRHLQEILSYFFLDTHIQNFSIIGSGHINDSIWIDKSDEDAFVLQRVNTDVFQDPKALGRNLELVSRHMGTWAAKYHPDDMKRRFVQIMPTKSGSSFLELDGAYWRLMYAIQDADTHEVLNSSEQAFEAGKLMGEFWVALSGLSPDEVAPTIDRFHDLRLRLEQLQAAFAGADEKRKAQAMTWVEHAEGLWHHLSPTVQMIENGELPQRVVHNDAKLSNVLFDKHAQKGLCVIDLDTVMPGYLLYDFGDMVRSMCCPVAEDDPNTAAVSCDMTYFEALAQGYLQASASHITAQEIESLVLSGTYMSLIMGMRFLADYLQGSIYYKTTYPTHNFDRARNQITLAQDLMRREKQLHSTLRLFL